MYNQKLCQANKASVNVNNMALYAPGAAINIMCYIVIRLFRSDEPGFFSGYNSVGALMVVVSNVFLGLAMTAVYKCTIIDSHVGVKISMLIDAIDADAVIKCFATAVSTGILLYLSPILFHADFSALVIPGTIVVFISTYMYMDATPPKTNTMAGPSKAEALPDVTEKLARRNFMHTFMPDVSNHIRTRRQY